MKWGSKLWDMSATEQPKRNNQLEVSELLRSEQKSRSALVTALETMQVNLPAAWRTAASLDGHKEQ